MGGRQDRWEDTVYFRGGRSYSEGPVDKVTFEHLKGQPTLCKWNEVTY